MVLSKELLEKAITTSNAYGFKHEDIQLVVDELRNKQMAIVFAQFQYIFPDETFNLYWLEINTQERLGTWPEYAHDSCSEFEVKYNEIYSNIDFHSEIKNFKALNQKALDGINVQDYFYCVIYAITEEEYLQENIRCFCG